MERYHIIFYLISGLFLVLLLLLITLRLSEFLDRRKFGNALSRPIFAEKSVKLIEKIQKKKYLRLLCDSIALRMSLLNSRSIEENNFYAAWIILCGGTVYIIISAVLIFACFPLWYVSLIYIFLIAGGLILAFIMLASFAANRFLKQMPEMLKYVASRYASRKNIVKAIGESINDVSSCLSNEMIRILDVLKQNDMQAVRQTFRNIEWKYKSEYMTLFLDLIWNAHFYGGNTEITKQFEEIIHDIMETMENRRDLASAARSYITMSVLFLPAVPGIKTFNSVLDNSAVYYNSLNGLFLLILFLVTILLFVALMVYLERSGS